VACGNICPLLILRYSIHGTVSSPQVGFAHNTIDNSDRNENFLGYEVYYKFYPFLPVPMEGDFGNDYAAVDGAAAASGKTTVEGRGFRRIWKAGDTVAYLPLIARDDRDPATEDADASDGFYVQILFPDRPSASSPYPATAHAYFHDEDGVPVVDGEGFPIVKSVLLVRDPQAATGPSGKTFESDDIATDPNDLDVPAGIPPTDDRIHMAIVILAYGTDVTDGTFGPLYSKPIMIEQPLEIILQ